MTMTAATADSELMHSGAKRTGLLRFAADRRTVGFVLTYFTLVGVALGTTMPWWGYAILCVAICWLSFFCAVATHNTVHAPVFRDRTLNRLFQVALTLTYGHPVSMYVPGHNLSHHKYMQTEKDRMRTDKLRFRWNLLNQLLFMFYVGPAITRDNVEYAKLMRVRRPSWYHQMLIELFALIAFVGLGLVFSLWPTFQLWKFFAFIILPHQYAAWGIMGINFVQHDGCDGDSKYNHSRNFTGKIVNWFVFNNGYHGIHHLHAGLHWSLCPAAHERDLKPYMDPRLEQKSLLAFLFTQYIFPGKRMRYDGTPVVLGPPREDQSWIDGPVREGTLNAEDAEFGAMS